MEQINYTKMCLLSIFVFFCTLAEAQISGSVMDTNNSPVMYSTVVLLNNSDSTLVKGNITDEAGAYVFDNVSDGQYLIRVSYVGFATAYSPVFTISQSQKAVILQSIQLQELSQSLEEVTITAQRALIEKQPDKLVMNLENSLLTKGSTADQILKIAPLVTSDMNGKLSLRGKTDVMILIDGKNVPDATLSTILQNMPADQIEKIEIITNPSAKYDAAASGGVINIITKKGLESGLNGTFRTSYSQGQRGRFSTGTSLNYRTAQLNIFSDLNYYNGNSYNVDNLIRQFPKAAYSMSNHTVYNSNAESFSGKVGLDFTPYENHTIGVLVDGYISGSEIQFDNRSDFMSLSTQPDSSIISYGNWLTDYDMYNFNVNYQGKLSNKGSSISINATQTLYQQNSNQFLSYQSVSVQGANVGKEQNIQTATPSDIHILIAQADYTLPIQDNFQLETGIKATRINTANNFSQVYFGDETQQAQTTDSSQLDYHENVNAGYISLKANLGKYSLLTGLRAEHTRTNVQNIIRRNFFNLFPSFSLNRDITENHTISLSYSRKIDRPVYDNLLPFRIIVDPYTIREGNPLLQPQYSHVIELTNTFKSITVLAGYTNIRNAMLDLPYQDEEKQVTIFSWRNFSLVETYNLSFVLPFQLTPWWQSNNTLTGLFNRVKTSNENIPNFEKDMLSFTFNSTNTFSLGHGMTAFVTGYYNSPSQYGIYKMLPVYSISMGIGKDIMRDLGTIKLSFSDMLWSERYRFNTKTESIIQEGNNFYDTRRLLLSFTYKFGKQSVKSTRSRTLGNEDEGNRISY